jgi:glutathione S-transferase
MKLYSSPTSPYVRKVLVLAYEAGLEPRIERIFRLSFPTAVNEELASQNPLAKVPTLITDAGEALYDSPVICEYLDGLHDGPRLFPSGEARWPALKLQALGDGLLDAAVLCRYERVLRPAEKRWPEWEAGQQEKIRRALDVLEGEAAHLAGPLTIGQISVACALGYLDFRFAAENWWRGRASLVAWYEPFSQRPSMVATVPKDPA